MLIYILSRDENLYSTRRLYLAGTKLRQNVRVVNHMHCDLLISDKGPEIYLNDQRLLVPDLVIPRIGSSVTEYGTAVVHHFEQMKIPVLNSSRGILDSRDKYKCLQILSKNGIPVPASYYSYDLNYAHKIVNSKLGYPFILKVLEGTQGKGVYLVHDEIEAEKLFNHFYRKSIRILLQEFISEFSGKDIRVIVVGNKIVASMMRVAEEGNFRANIHQGGKGENITLSEKEKDIAIRSCQILGLKFAGVDILRSVNGPMVLEVNSSPGLEGIETTTKVSIGTEVFNEALKMIE
ncbi:MAG: RimK family alpha-L-glutamate ligase [Crocinitomicaceae bacterium]|nr:RimK family alpha-L-glutamate ligase [Crocinitomicaceae bacterium]